MKVILLENIKSLGKEGAVIEVSDGHARNFLFPQNMAVPATEDALRAIREREQSVRKQSKKVIVAAGKLAERLSGYELTLEEKANDEGVLYAAVTPKAVAKALRKAGFEVEEEMVVLANPIKSTGQYHLTLELAGDFEADITLVVEAE